jgi:hypothetical protein
MLTSVHLDDEAAFEADEVQVEAEQWRLAAKMEPVGAQSSQLEPEPGFLRREGLSEFPGAFD